MPELSVVIVSYRCRDLLRDCLAAHRDEVDMEVIVLDNDSGDDTLAAADAHPWVQAEDLGENGPAPPRLRVRNGYRELVHRCGIMCAPTEVGGTHPVIIDGMAAGAALVVGDDDAFFPLDGGADALAAVLDALADDPARREDLERRAAARAAQRYSWDACADAYLRLCEAVLAASGSR